jgi:FKBP-type peptidyl-prolyl cis-trans isomerase
MIVYVNFDMNILGEVFDSSYQRRTPLVFKAGVRQVISGWDEALLLGSSTSDSSANSAIAEGTKEDTRMHVGTVREVIIPASLGYGTRGAGGVIPPNSTLYFRMELVGIGNKANR